MGRKSGCRWPGVRVICSHAFGLQRSLCGFRAEALTTWSAGGLRCQRGSGRGATWPVSEASQLSGRSQAVSAPRGRAVTHGGWSRGSSPKTEDWSLGWTRSVPPPANSSMCTMAGGRANGVAAACGACVTLQLLWEEYAQVHPDGYGRTVDRLTHPLIETVRIVRAGRSGGLTQKVTDLVSLRDMSAMGAAGRGRRRRPSHRRPHRRQGCRCPRRRQARRRRPCRRANRCHRRPKACRHAPS